MRLQVLRDELLRRTCASRGVTEFAAQMDYAVPLDVGPERAVDRANLRSLCTPCHARKSTAEREGRGELAL